MFGVVITSTDAQRRRWLEEVKAMIDSVFPKEEDPGRTI
jgi:hypothetical protein